MKRTARDKNESAPAPVKKIELDDKHFKLRLILTVIFIIIALVAVYFGIKSCNSHDAGWQRINVADKSILSSAPDFVFYYDVGADGANPTAEYKLLTALYSSLCQESYNIFNSDVKVADVKNIAFLCENPNVETEVELALYEAFKLLSESSDRTVFLAPVSARNEALLSCDSETEASAYDPDNVEEEKTFISEAMAFISDPNAVSVVLRGDNKVTLRVSAEYSEFMKEQELTAYLDFGHLKNAFICDYIADGMIQNGFTCGTISSYDGYMRTFDERGTSYTVNLFTRSDKTVYAAASANFTRPISVVSYRNYALYERDEDRFFEFEDGRIFTPYINSLTGRSVSATDTLYGYSYALNCAATAVNMNKIYISSALSESMILAAKQNGAYSVYFDDEKIMCNDENIAVSNLGFYENKPFLVRFF